MWNEIRTTLSTVESLLNERIIFYISIYTIKVHLKINKHFVLNSM